nr:ribonuclease H-like domain-containing protein [Tanacetum cinerariifolium]
MTKLEHSNSQKGQRLGHPSYQVLTILKHKLDLDKDDLNGPCEVSHRKKHTREPFPLSDHKTANLGAIQQEAATFDEGGSIPKENTFIQQENGTLCENLSEDEDFDLFGNMFDPIESENLTNVRDSQSNVPRMSSRMTNLPKKLSDFVLDKNVKWIEAINLELEALNINNTCILTELPSDRKPIGCKWVFKIKYRSDESIERSKARLVTKGYNQKEGIDYEETFSPIVKIVTLRCIISLDVSSNCPMYQLDINNAFLYEELVEVVYMKLPKGYFDENDNRVCKLTRPDLRYVVHCLSQLMHSPMQSHLKLAFKILRYLKGSPGKGITFEKSEQFGIKLFVDCDWGMCKVTKKFVTGFAVHLGNNMVSWKSKEQSVLARSSAEAEFRAMSSMTCKVMWMLKVCNDLKVQVVLPVVMNCDKSSAMQISSNPVLHERTKHFEIDLFVLRDKIIDGTIRTIKVRSEENVVDIFTKGLNVEDHKRFCDMLKLKDMFQP